MGPINAYFDYIFIVRSYFHKYLYNSIFLVIFRLIFNIPLYIIHRIITHKYYNVFPIIGKEFYLTFCS